MVLMNSFVPLRSELVLKFLPDMGSVCVELVVPGLEEVMMDEVLRAFSQSRCGTMLTSLFLGGCNECPVLLSWDPSLRITCVLKC